MTQKRHEIQALEVLEDVSAKTKWNEGFLHVRRLRVRNHRADGSFSAAFQVDVVERPKLDAVSVLIFRKNPDGVREFLTRTVIRPAAYFRKDKTPVVPDGVEHLFCEEIVAGVLENSDQGHEGILKRAAAEVEEEAGISVRADQILVLGHPFFPAPGIVSEKIHVTCVDVTGLEMDEPQGDGTPLEEGGKLQWRTEQDFLRAIDDGTIQDSKTEIALRRFLRVRLTD